MLLLNIFYVNIFFFKKPQNACHKDIMSPYFKALIHYLSTIDM